MPAGLRALLFGLLTGLALPLSAVEVEVKGLFQERALVSIDGEVVLLKSGESRAGVSLLGADSQKAVLEIDGVVHELGLSRRISSSFTEAGSAEVRLPPGPGGHYSAMVRINNRPVEAMVDTGATAVAMSRPQATALGIDYRSGQVVKVTTANGVVDSYLVTLASVAVGDVRLERVEALVNMGDFPHTVLLGNSFLSRVHMFRENGLLVLQQAY